MNYATVKSIHERLGLPFEVDENITDEELQQLLNPSDIQSRSGDGLNTPSGGLNGTATNNDNIGNNVNNMRSTNE